jgi:hypothetical protein
MKLWLDDLRQPPDETWVWAKCFDDARDFLLLCSIHGDPIFIASLDHDLGGVPESYQGKTGFDVVCFMQEEEIWPRRIIIHSHNPVGARRMAELAGEWTSVIIQPFVPKADT